MNEIIIRTAKIEDAEEILQIYSFYVKNTVITFEYEVPTLEEFSARIKNTLKKYPYLVAIKDEKIVGYAYAGTFKARAAYDWSVESTIYIHKDYKNCGIGKVLYTELEITLQKMNITNINACIAYAKIEDEYLTNASCRFHEKMGYKTVGRFTNSGYKFNRWYDMIWMEKIINPHTENQPPVIKFSDL